LGSVIRWRERTQAGSLCYIDFRTVARSPRAISGVIAVHPHLTTRRAKAAEASSLCFVCTVERWVQRQDNPLSWSAVPGTEQLKGAGGGANFVAKFGEHFASDFELLRFALRPMLRGGLQTMVSVCNVSGSCRVEAWPGECCLKPALRFGELCKEDFFLGDAAQFADQTETGEGPDQPFGRVDLPRLHAVAIIMLKLVVIIMVPLAEGHDRHEPGVTGAAFGRVGALAEVVAHRIDAKGAVLKDDDPRHPRDQKGAKGRDPATPSKAKDRWKYKGDRCADPVNMAMLPSNQRILLQVSHVIERRAWVELK
jgi:hypothetical protein